MIKGIDISDHQGVVDFSRMKQDVDFIILRCSYGQKADARFKRNLAECERLNIPYGVYHYSYALTLDYAMREADLTLSLIKGHNPVMGVWFDMEDADQYKKKHGMPSKNALTDMCVAFCDKIKAAGYETGVYASLSWFTSMLDDSRLRYRHWVAQWASRCRYKGVIDMWQYTNKTSAGGRSPLDGNYAYTLPKEEDMTFTDVPKTHWAYKYIDKVSDAGIMNGIGDGKFAPDEPLTRAQICKILVAAGVVK